MAIPGFNSVPLSVAGSGAAVILKNDNTALGILQSGQRARDLRAQREALQRAKDAAALSKQLSEDRKLGLDTGGAFQEPFNGSVAGVQDYFTDQYKQLQAGQINQLQLGQNIANKKNEVERERLLGVDKDKLIAGYETSQSANKYRDKDGLHTALGETLLNPDGTRVRATQYDERGTLSKLDADPRTYNPDPIISDYFAKQQASTLEDAAAGRIGGLHSSSNVTYKGFTPIRRADGRWDVKRGNDGLPEIKTSEKELATERSVNHDLNMAVSRLEFEEGKKAKAENRAPRPTLELYREAASKYASVKQNESVGLNAQPRAGRAGAKTAVIEEDTTAPQAPGTYNASVQVPGSLPITGYTGERVGTLSGTVAQDGFDHYGKGTRPKLTKKDGTQVDVEANSFNPDGFYQDDGKGRFTFTKNKTPMAGSYGEPFKMLVDSKTKQLRYPKKGEDVQELIRSGQAEYATQLEFNSHKNENYTADLTTITNELLKERNSDGEPKFKSRALAELKAKESLQKGTARKLVQYNQSNAISIDRDTKTNKGRGFYKAFDDAVQAENARIRATKSTRKDLLNFAPAAAGKTTKLKTVGKNNALGF